MQGAKREKGPENRDSGRPQALATALHQGFDLGLAEGLVHQPIGHVVDETGPRARLLRVDPESVVLHGFPVLRREPRRAFILSRLRRFGDMADGEHPGRGGAAAHGHLADLLEGEIAAGFLDRALAGQDVGAILFVEIFKAGGDVDLVTVHGEDEPVLGGPRPRPPSRRC